MGDSTAHAMYLRGIDAVKYYTPLYDTGSWTRYSLLQGLNTRFYHAFHVQLIDALYSQSHDSDLAIIGNRWRAYTPPSGI
jgi:D-glucuronyl C5-epimerase-like protein